MADVSTYIQDGTQILNSITGAINSFKSGTPSQTQTPTQVVVQQAQPTSTGVSGVLQKYGLYIGIGMVGFIIILIFRGKLKA